MIVPMKKTTLICLKTDQIRTLEKLQDLGLMHVEVSEKPTDSEDRQSLTQDIAVLERAVGILSGRTAKTNTDLSLSNEELKGECLKAIDENLSLRKEIEQLRREHERFLPWGEFSGKLVHDLRQNGIYVYLCIGSQKDLDQLPETVSVKIIKAEKKKLFYAIISRDELDTSEMTVVSLPADISLRRIDEELTQKQLLLDETESRLDELAGQFQELESILLAAREKLEFVTNRDSMIEADTLLYIQGFVPAPQFEELKQAAESNGWALQHEDADIEDPEVPTLLKIPKAFRIIEPMLKFLGISPGYDEVDVSICFLFFLTIFFGMILGDGGYGILFILLSLFLRFKFKSPALRRPINLFLTFSVSTLIWGSLTGNFFGIDSPNRPSFMKGIDFFTKPDIKDRNVQMFCFILAVLHLTTGRLWRAVLYRTSIRKMLGEIGWAVVLWGNFFVTLRLLVFPGAIENYVLIIYAVGFGLVLLCGVNWLDAGEVFNLPFGAIGTFVDILSYIRLYAVGMSGFYIANSFNSMGCNVFNLSKSPYLIPLLVVGGVLVILFGHLLNVALCLMGVLVHGVRLNTLEFSNHIGLRWAGHQFKPFAKSIESNNDKGEEK